MLKLTCPILALFASTLLSAQPADTARAREAATQGRAALQTGRIDEGVKLLERAVEMDPTCSEYHMWLGHALSRKISTVSFIKKPIVGKRIGAAYNRAVELAPESVEAAESRLEFFINAPGIAGGGMDKARAEAARIASLSAMHGHFAQARLALAKHDTALAESEYRSAMTQYSDSSRPLVLLATLLADQKHFEDAFAIVDERLSRAPNDTVSLYLVGRTAALSGTQLDRGEAALRRYLTLVGDNLMDKAAAHYRLGMIKEQLADTVAARAEYRLAIESNPGYTAAARALKKIGG